MIGCTVTFHATEKSPRFFRMSHRNVDTVSSESELSDRLKTIRSECLQDPLFKFRIACIFYSCHRGHYEVSIPRVLQIGFHDPHTPVLPFLLNIFWSHS